MANITELVQFDASIYQLETTDPVQGGVNGISNAQAKSLANRTAYLKKHIDDIESGDFIPEGLAELNSPALTGTPTSPTAAVGDNSTKIATTAFAHREANGLLSKSVAGGVNVTLTAAEVGYSILVLTGAITANIAVIVPAASGNWVVVNRTTGAFSLTVKTPAGSGVAITQGKSMDVTCDGTNVFASRTDFGGVDLGAVTAATPPQFDNDTSVATTAFVQKAAGSNAGYIAFGAGGAQVLTAADAGKAIVLTGGTSGTLALPALASVPDGTSFTIKNEALASWSVTAAAGDASALSYGNGAYASTPILQDNFIVFVKGSGMWRTYGTGVMQYSGSFAASKAGSGYQKLPSGLIIQWGANSSGNDSSGVLVNLPIAFPNGFLHALGSDSGSVCAAFGCESIGSLSQFRLYGRDHTGLFANYICRWLAIGH